MVMDPSDCSKKAKKNTVKKPKIDTAIILSLTTGRYLAILVTNKIRNNTKADSTTKLVPLNWPTVNGAKLVPWIISKGSLKRYNKPPKDDRTIKILSKGVNGFNLISSSRSPGFPISLALLLDGNRISFPFNGFPPIFPKRSFANQNCSIPNIIKIPARPKPHDQP